LVRLVGGTHKGAHKGKKKKEGTEILTTHQSMQAMPPNLNLTPQAYPTKPLQKKTQKEGF
jgi:hypothetical protein